MRKSKYETQVLPRLDIIEGWARNGLTLDDIAHNLGISKTTLVKYEKSHEELKKAIENGREIADIRVENALYRKACGFYSQETKLIKVKNADGEEHVEEHVFDAYHPPDTTAIIFWLKNRKPEAWRDKVTFEEETEETLNNVLRITKRDIIENNKKEENSSGMGTTAKASRVSGAE